MQFQRRRPAVNAKADAAMNAFYGTVGSPIQMSTFERHMEKMRHAKKKDANTAIAPPAAVTMAPTSPRAQLQTPLDPQPEPTPCESAPDALTLEAKKENKIIFHKELKQHAPAPLVAHETKENDILSVQESSSDDSEDGGADIATVRNDRGRAREHRRSTEFMGLTVEPVQQLRLDGARKAKIPHFMSAWFNVEQTVEESKTPDDKQTTAAEPPAPIPVAVPVVTPPVDVSSMSIDETTSISSNPKLSGMQGRGYRQSINFSEIKLGRMIGEGAFGKVYEGKWREKGVAVKVLVCQELRSDILREFQSEVEIMSVLRHPNICRLLGACMEAPHRALVVELMQRGSLWGVLRTHRKTLDMDQRTRFIYDTAKGMAYLHHFERPILHRDLKSPNLLVDKNYNIKLSDFGLARVKAHVQTMTGNCGTVQWMAPEILGNQKYTEKADVFSFAIVVWEIMTGECPYDGMSQIQVGLGILNRNLRPDIPSNCPPFFSRLMKSCWNRQPELRPSFPHILNAFRTYQTSLSETRASRRAAESANAAIAAAT